MYLLYLIVLCMHIILLQIQNTLRLRFIQLSSEKISDKSLMNAEACFSSFPSTPLLSTFWKTMLPCLSW